MFAKWPLTDMTEGAVGCRVLVEGRRGEDRAAMTQTKTTNTSYKANDARDVAAGD